MYAIALTYDDNHIFSDHMIHKYAQLWPDHPFVFRVPYQQNRSLINSSKVEYIQSPKPIKPTIFELLKGLDEDEIIYWCMDDKYPINLNIKIIRGIYDWYPLQKDTTIGAIQFCR